jgi:hypothetical protein
MALKFANLMAMWRKPFYATAGVFRTDEDLTWIPDTTLNFVIEASATEADGTETEFTFEGTPRFVMLDGQWRRENHGYTLNGTVVTFTDSNGEIFAPREGAEIVAVV